MRSGPLGAQGVDDLLAALSAESPATLVRLALERALEEGLEFDEAWGLVMRRIGRSHGNWSAAWRISREHWESAYRRRQAADRPRVAA